MGRRERSGVSDTGFALAALRLRYAYVRAHDQLRRAVYCQLLHSAQTRHGVHQQLTSEAAPAASKRMPDGFHQDGGAAPKAAPFPSPKQRAAALDDAGAVRPFPSPEHDYAACRPSKGRLHES